MALTESRPSPQTSLEESLPIPKTSLEESLPIPKTSLEESLPIPKTSLEESLPFSDSFLIPSDASDLSTEDSLTQAQEEYQEFMDLLSERGTQEQRWTHTDGRRRYLITDDEFDIWVPLFLQLAELDQAPIMKILVPERKKFHLYHQLMHIPSHRIRDLLQHLENQIIQQFQLKHPEQLKYNLDGLEHNHFQFRIFWYYRGRALTVQKRQARFMVSRIQHRYPEEGAFLDDSYEQTPMIGSRIQVDPEKEIFDRYLPLCCPEISEQDLYSHSVVNYQALSLST